MLSQSQILEAFRELLLPHWNKQCHPVSGQMPEIDRWWHGKQAAPEVPARANYEYSELAQDSRSPWANLLVKAPTQQLFVEGYRRTDDDGENQAWRVWQRNRMDSRQIALHGAGIAHGASFLNILPGRPDPLTGEALPAMIGYSARRMAVLFADYQDWPMWSIEAKPMGNGSTETLFTIQDEEAIYRIASELDDPRTARFVDVAVHGSPVCPVVRYAPALDLDGRARGEIEMVMPILRRLDRDVFDRVIAQRYASIKVRYATGMVKPESEEEKRAIEAMLQAGSVFMNESPDGRFGTLDATDLTQFNAVLKSDLETFAAITQIPPAQLLGTVANLSAEGLAAAEAQLMRKVDEFKYSYGESHEQALSLVEMLLTGSTDMSAQVRWKDVSAKSLSATADALGKLASMLGVPVQVLWERIPGFTQQDIERATALRENDPMSTLANVLSAQSGGLDVPAGGGAE